VVAAVVLRDRLLALGAGLGRSFLSFLAHKLVELLVGLRVLDGPLVVLFLVRLPRRLLLHDVGAVAVVSGADLAPHEGTAETEGPVALLADVQRARGRVGLVVEGVIALVPGTAAQALLVAVLRRRLVEQRLRRDLLVLGPRRLVAAVVRAGSNIEDV